MSPLTPSTSPSEQGIRQPIELNTDLNLTSDDGSIIFNGSVSFRDDTLLIDAQLGYMEDGEQKGSTLYHQVPLAQDGNRQVATLSKYPNTPHPVVTVTLVDGQASINITPGQVPDRFDAGTGTYRV